MKYLVCGSYFSLYKVFPFFGLAPGLTADVLALLFVIICRIGLMSCVKGIYKVVGLWWHGVVHLNNTNPQCFLGNNCFSPPSVPGIHIRGAVLWCVDQQLGSDLRWLPHALRLLCSSPGSFCCTHDPLEGYQNLLLWVTVAAPNRIWKKKRKQYKCYKCVDYFMHWCCKVTKEKPVE